MSARRQRLTVGERLGPLDKGPLTTRQLVMYAGASGDFNRIHYDEPFAREAGFPSVIVHGMLSMAFFGELLSGAVGPTRVRALSARFRAVAVPGEVLTLTGEVTEADGEQATLALVARRADGVVVLEGSARVTQE